MTFYFELCLGPDRDFNSLALERRPAKAHEVIHSWRFGGNHGFFCTGGNHIQFNDGFLVVMDKYLMNPVITFMYLTGPENQATMLIDPMFWVNGWSPCRLTSIV